MKLAGTGAGALEAAAAEVLASAEPRARKLAYLRVLQDSGSAEWVRWAEHAVRTLPEAPDARGESVPHFGLRRLGLAAQRNADALLALERLAFESSELHPHLRREAARSYAEQCEFGALADLCRRLSAERDPSVVAAALASLDARAAEPGVRSVLSLFESHPRPAPTESDSAR